MFAFKRELFFNGVAQEDLWVEENLWDGVADKALRYFQQEQGLNVDGQLGPETARLLFHRRATDIEKRHGVAAGVLCRLKTCLSQNDPVAEASHELDCEGLMQINLRYNPLISKEQAWDPQFAMEHAASWLAIAYEYVGEDWEGALAAYVIGRSPAADWVTCQKPPGGGITLGSRDTFERAFEFVGSVQGCAC